MVAAIAMALAGCQGMEYVNDNYAGVPVASYTITAADMPRILAGGEVIKAGDRFRIFDKPSEGRLMITLGLGAAAARGSANGLTFGMASPKGSQGGVMSAAAARYLASTGRECTTQLATLLIEPQYEVRYSCAALAAASPN